MISLKAKTLKAISEPLTFLGNNTLYTFDHNLGAVPDWVHVVDTHSSNRHMEDHYLDGVGRGWQVQLKTTTQVQVFAHNLWDTPAGGSIRIHCYVIG